MKDNQSLIHNNTINNIANAIKIKNNITNNTITTSEMPQLILGHKGIEFASTKTEDIMFTATGKGTIYIMKNGAKVNEILLNENSSQKITLAPPHTDINYTIMGIHNLLELDMSDNEITSFTINDLTPLNKLVLNNNLITALNCSNCMELQFLHFFNNPICDNEQYENNLTTCLNNLPDRSNTSIGSIVFYPWYGLETLICKIDDEYKKYPITTWTDIDDNTQKDSYNTEHELTIIKNKLYGVVNSDNSITYYIGADDNTLILHSSMNRHHQLRKLYEKLYTLSKNWMFGSAIQYHEEYKYCHYFFRDIGVQHVWETAEKGFGMCIGSIDQFPGKALGWEDMNILDHLNAKGDRLIPRDQDNYAHGDSILSQIVGRGDNVSYGICPNATILPIDVSGYELTEDGFSYWRNSIKRIANNCTSYTSSYSTGNTKSKHAEVWAQTRLYLGRFGENNIITVAAGNEGLDQPWLKRENNYYSTTYGDYGIEENVLSLEHHTNTFFVGSLCPDRKLSAFSSPTIDAQPVVTVQSKTFSPKLPTQDYLSSYGEQILAYRNNTKSMGCTQGTSMASPNCNATLALMRIIYSKIHPECTSFGKNSEFMNYVITHWLDPIEGEMDFAVGLGIPCFITAPRQKLNTLDQHTGILSTVNYTVGHPFKIVGIDFDNCKLGRTFEYNYQDFAQITPTELIPLHAQNSNITAHTNSSVKSPQDPYKNYYSNSLSIQNIKSNDNISLINNGLINDKSWFDDNGQIVVKNNNNAKEYTVQIAIKMDPDKLYDIVAEGTYNGPIRLIHYTNNNTTMCIILDQITVKVTKQDDGSLFKKIEFEGLDSKNRTTPTAFTHATRDSNVPGNIVSVLSKAPRLGLAQGNIIILTVTYKNGEFNYYYNGNFIGKVITWNQKFNDLSKVTIPQSAPLCNDSLDDTLFYDRALSHEEIINNTIVLLHNNNEEVNT